jgi:hypothetical protein
MNPLLTSALFYPQPSITSSPSTKKKSWDSTASLKRLLSGHTPPGTSLGILPKLPVLPGLSPMTFDALTSSPTPTRPKSNPGLFEALLNDPRALLNDYYERPDEHDPRLIATLTMLLNGNKTINDLSPEEMDLLNQATRVYAEPKRASKPFDKSDLNTSTFKNLGEEPEDEDEEIYVESPMGKGEISLEDFPLLAEGWWNNKL